MLEQDRPGTYYVQKLPFTARNRRGRNKRLKESAARMERIPSTVVIHKTTDGMDTRTATIHRPMVSNPLENTLGPAQFGTYRQAPAHQAYAFDRIEDIWGENDLDLDDRESDSESSDDLEGGPDDTHGPNAEPIATPMDEADDDTGDAETAEHEQDNESRRRDTASRRRTRSRRGTATINTNDGTNVPERTEDSNLRRSKQARLVPGRFKGVVTHVVTRAQQIYALQENIRASRDKMIILEYQEPGTTRRQWYVAQVLMRESEERADIEKGYYMVRLWIRHAKDSQQRTQRSCRYWPEVKYRRPNGTLGAIAMVKPSKTERILQQRNKYTARDEQFNLDKYMMVGPFNFGIPREYDNQPNRVPDGVWIDMVHQAERRNIEASDINQVVPLTAANRLDK